MKMAKATKEDIQVMQQFFDALERKIEEEIKSNDDEETSDKKLADWLRNAWAWSTLASSRNRVIIGCDILIDTVCDPAKSYLDYKPELRKLIPETENEQGEKLFYVISYTHSQRGVLTLWGANNVGYTSNVKRAGKYTESQIRGNLAYYHQGESAVAISVAEFHEKFQISENVWHNWDQRKIHMERVKLGILEEVKEEVVSDQT